MIAIFFQKGPNMIAISKNIVESRGYDFWTNLDEIYGRKDCNNIWSDSEFPLQSYLVPCFIKISIIFGLNCFLHCKHNWSLS